MASAEQPRLTRISLDDDSIEELLMMRVGPNLYRLEESSVFGEVQYHDIVEAETQTGGTLRFLRVATPSGLKTVSWLLPKATFEAPTLSALLDRVMASGGNWERTFGGLLALHLPPDAADLILHDFDAFLETLQARSSGVLK